MNCPKKYRRQVRLQLAMFAAANFCLGLATFMFFICSNSPEHLKALNQFASDPIAFILGHDHSQHN